MSSSQKPIRLSKRLSAIAMLITKDSNVADIGTDHGYLPVYLAQKGQARRIIASDISAGSLNAARNSALKYGVVDKITFVTAPGLTGVREDEADTIVIAGMGGETISHILADASWTKRKGIKIILQPQTKTAELCTWLYKNGYIINDAQLASDRGRFYTILLASANQLQRPPTHGYMELLTILAAKGDPLFREYIENIIKKTRIAAEGMARSGVPGLHEAALMLTALEELKTTYNLTCEKTSK